MVSISPASHRNSNTEIIPTRPTQKRPETTEFGIINSTMKITLANVVASALLVFATAEEPHNLREVKSGKLSELAGTETEGEFCGAQRRCVLQTILIGLVLEYQQLSMSSLSDLFRPFDI